MDNRNRPNNLMNQNKKKHKTAGIAACLSALVILITTYLLMMPATTLEHKPVCGLEEHIHTLECYQICGQDESELVTGGLVCPFVPHTHTEACYDENGNAVCGYAPYTFHIHNDLCYSSDQNSDENAEQTRSLVCKLPELTHVHTDACYTEERVLKCAKKEDANHIHSDECGFVDHVTCGLEEGENGHVHSIDCITREYLCGLEEGETHHHTSDCFQITRTYSCGYPEVLDHVHTSACFDENGHAICGFIEIPRHEHTNACLEILSGHVHTADCYAAEPQCGLTAHEHTDACFQGDPAGWEEYLASKQAAQNTDGVSDTETTIKDEVSDTEDSTNPESEGTGETENPSDPSADDTSTQENTEANNTDGTSNTDETNNDESETAGDENGEPAASITQTVQSIVGTGNVINVFSAAEEGRELPISMMGSVSLLTDGDTYSEAISKLLSVLGESELPENVQANVYTVSISGEDAYDGTFHIDAEIAPAIEADYFEIYRVDGDAQLVGAESAGVSVSNDAASSLWLNTDSSVTFVLVGVTEDDFFFEDAYVSREISMDTPISVFEILEEAEVEEPVESVTQADPELISVSPDEAGIDWIISAISEFETTDVVIQLEEAGKVFLTLTYVQSEPAEAKAKLPESISVELVDDETLSIAELLQANNIDAQVVSVESAGDVIEVEKSEQPESSEEDYLLTAAGTFKTTELNVTLDTDETISVSVEHYVTAIEGSFDADNVTMQTTQPLPGDAEVTYTRQSEDDATEAIQLVTDFENAMARPKMLKRSPLKTTMRTMNSLQSTEPSLSEPVTESVTSYAVFDVAVYSEGEKYEDDMGSVCVTIHPDGLNLYAGIPENAKVSSEPQYTLYHVHNDGTVETINEYTVDLSANGDVETFTFTTFGFSSFVLKYTFQYTIENNEYTMDLDFTGYEPLNEENNDLFVYSVDTGLIEASLADVFALISDNPDGVTADDSEAAQAFDAANAAEVSSDGDGNVHYVDGNLVILGNGQIVLTDGTNTLTVSISGLTSLIEEILEAENGVTIQVLEGSVPKGATSSFHTLSDADTEEAARQIQDIISETAGEQTAQSETSDADENDAAEPQGKSVQTTETRYAGFDLSIYTGEDLYTEDGMFKVQIPVASILPENANLENLRLYHVHGETIEEITDVKAEGDYVEFTTVNFSTFIASYTVDFSYDVVTRYTVTLAPQGVKYLSEIVENIQLDKVENVQIDDESEVAIEKTENDWKFTNNTDEEKTVTFVVNYTEEFSIEGGKQILLSTLITTLHITDEYGDLVEVKNVDSVSFTDETLISVEPVSGIVSVNGEDIDVGEKDFLLTSNEPFNSLENLILNMKDGSKKNIDVTDAAEMDIKPLLDSAVITIGGTPVTGDQWTVIDGETYDIKLNFSEKSWLQFPDDGTTSMVYQLPSNVKVQPTSKTFNMTISRYGRTYVLTGNTMVIDANGKITLNWNTSSEYWDDLQAADNAKIEIDITGKIEKGSGQIIFSDTVTKTTEIKDPHDMGITKNGVYNPDTGKVTYTVVVSSKGNNTNIVITDDMNGTALVFDGLASINVSGASNVSKEVNGKGFKLSIPSMNNGDIATITYTATVDKSKIGKSGNATYDETNNSVKVQIPSDDNPNNNEATDYQHDISFSNFSKSVKSIGDIVEVKDGDTVKERYKIVEWEIVTNENPTTSLAGSTITDRNGTNWAMSYIDDATGLSSAYAGIKVDVYDVNGQKVDTREINYGSEGLSKNGNDSWVYTIPSTDTAPYKYVIKYQTKVNVLNQAVDLAVTNSGEGKGGSDGGNYTIGGDGQNGGGSEPSNKPEVKKTATYVDDKNITWKIQVTIPAEGYKQDFKIVDKLPVYFYSENGVNYYLADSLIDLNDPKSNFTVHELLSGEDYDVTVENATDNSFNIGENALITLQFYKNPSHEKGIQGTGSPRILEITYNTNVNQEWLMREMAKSAVDPFTANEGLVHYNNVSVTGDAETVGTNGNATPQGVSLEKYVTNGSGQKLTETSFDSLWTTSLPVDEVYYPALLYTIRLSGVKQEQIVIKDTFDTNVFGIWPVVDISHYQSLECYGGNQYGALSGFTHKYGSVRETATGADLIIDIPRSADGSYADYYYFTYYLYIKNEDLIMERASGNGGVDVESNTASWNGESGKVDITYTYDGLKKSQIAFDQDTNTGTYQIVLNPNKLTLNGGKPMTMTDTMRNLSIVYASVKFETDPAGRENISFDYKGNVGTFIIPDETKVIITYDAKVIGNPGDIVEYSNTAEMSGFADGHSGSETFSAEAGGSASVFNVNLFKYEAGHMEKGLDGAIFQLLDENKNPILNKNGNPITFTTQTVNDIGGVHYTPAKTGYVEISLNKSRDGVALQKGTRYYLKEIQTADDTKYAIDNTYYGFMISDSANYNQYIYHNNDTLKVYNTEKNGRLEITKNIEGAENLTQKQKEAITFEVTNNALGTANYYKKTFTYADFTNGVYKLEDLPVVGTYKVKETSGTISGYNLTATTVSVDGGSETSGIFAEGLTVNTETAKKVTFKNTYTPNGAKINVIKVDSKTDDKTLFGAEFQLQMLNGSEYVNLENGALDSNGKFVISYSNKDSGVSVSGLTDGQYRLVETKAPTGYVALIDHIDFTVNGTSVTYSGGNSSVSYTDGTFRIKNEEEHSYTFTKIYQNNGSTFTLPGAVFGVFKASDDVEILSERFTTDANGQGMVAKKENNFADHTMYYVKEITAPEGFKLNETKYYFAFGEVTGASVEYKNLLSDDATADVNDEVDNKKIQVKKVWSDNQTEITEIKFTIKQIAKDNDGNVVQTIDLYTDQSVTVSNNWLSNEYSVPKVGVISGKIVTFEYEVVENKVEHYLAEYSGPVTEGEVEKYTITNNKYNGIRLKVEKVWNDNGNEVMRPDSITVRLYSSKDNFVSPMTGKDIVLTDSNGWKGEWTELDDAYTYQVIEETVPGYTTTYSETDGKYKVEGEKNVDGSTVTITNSRSSTTPSTGSIEIKKVWVDGQNNRITDTSELPSVQFELNGTPKDGAVQREGTPITVYAVIGYGSTNNTGLTVNAYAGDNIVFKYIVSTYNWGNYIETVNPNISVHYKKDNGGWTSEENVSVNTTGSTDSSKLYTFEVPSGTDTVFVRIERNEDAAKETIISHSTFVGADVNGDTNTYPITLTLSSPNWYAYQGGLDLAHNTYTLKEIVSTSADYETIKYEVNGTNVTPDTSGLVNVSTGTVVVTNKKNTTGSLKITKAVTKNGATTNDPKTDGTYTFEIWKDGSKVTQKADGTSIGDLQITVTKGVADKEIVVDGLTPGAYVVKETASTNTVIIKDTDKNVTVVAGDTTGVQATAAFTNDLKVGKIIVNKSVTYNGVTDTETNGTTFYFGVFSDEATTTKVDEFLLTIGADGTGAGQSAELPLGTYYVYELTDQNGTAIKESTGTIGGVEYTISGTGLVTLNTSELVVNITNSQEESGSLTVTKTVTGKTVTADETFNVGLYEKSGTDWIAVNTPGTENAWTETITVAANTSSKSVTFSPLTIGKTYRVYELNGTEKVERHYEEYTVTYGDDNGVLIGRGTDKNKTTTITNNKETTNVSAKKEWPAGQTVPEGTSIKFTISATASSTPVDMTALGLASGAEVISLPKSEGTDTEKWTATWSDLPKYHGGELVTYTVTETEYKIGELTITNLPAAAEVDNSGEVTIHNDLPTIDISVQKTWSGVTPADGDYVIFTLYKGETTYTTGDPATSLTQKLQANNEEADKNWKGKFEGLPKYDTDGSLITWTVKETAVKLGGNEITDAEKIAQMFGTDTQIEAKEISGTFNGDTVTLTNTPATTNLSGKKFWAISGSTTPANPTLKLTRTINSNTEIAVKKADAGFEWKGTAGASDELYQPDWPTSGTYKYSDLPKYDNNGNEYTYEVSEASFTTSAGTYTVTKGAEGKYTVTAPENAAAFTVSQTDNDITNTELTQVKALKIWKDAKGRELTTLPGMITLQLKQGNEDYGDAVELTGTSTEKVTIGGVEYTAWTHTWTDLPVGHFVGDEYTPYTYSVTEVSIKKGETTITIDGDKATDGTWFVSYSNNEGNMLITNTLNETDFTFSKKWLVNDAETDWKAGTKITLTLSRTLTALASDNGSAPTDNYSKTIEITYNGADSESEFTISAGDLTITPSISGKITTFTISHLPAKYNGRDCVYEITETKLDGYNAPIYKVGSADSKGDGTEITNAAISYALPSTGGPGVGSVYGLGALLTLLAVAGLVLKKRK